MTNMPIFVFGSNEIGAHGAGAARWAYRFRGAILGRAEGIQGESYAIPTKDKTIRNTLSLIQIKTYVNNFIEFALRNPDKEFQVTRIGCGLAGLHDADIAPMFKDAPTNCLFDEVWKQYLPDGKRYWGSY